MSMLIDIPLIFLMLRIISELYNDVSKDVYKRMREAELCEEEKE